MSMKLAKDRPLQQKTSTLILRPVQFLDAWLILSFDDSEKNVHRSPFYWRIQCPLCLVDPEKWSQRWPLFIALNFFRRVSVSCRLRSIFALCNRKKALLSFVLWNILMRDQFCLLTIQKKTYIVPFLLAHPMALCVLSIQRNSATALDTFHCT